ncbi:hypothetical protein KD33_07790 [Clostridium sp. NCR]|nr:hypothetical protein KD33_07790 [Clostridium sp. NCR]
MDKVRIGELRNKIEIQTYQEIVNDYGGTENTYTTIATPRAKVKYVSSRETDNTTTYDIRFIIRYRKGITNNNHFVKFDNQVYNIEHVYPFEDLSFMELSCNLVK